MYAELYRLNYKDEDIENLSPERATEIIAKIILNPKPTFKKEEPKPANPETSKTETALPDEQAFERKENFKVESVKEAEPEIKPEIEEKPFRVNEHFKSPLEVVRDNQPATPSPSPSPGFNLLWIAAILIFIALIIILYVIYKQGKLPVLKAA